MRKIVICLDGTGNEVGDRETNVLKLYKGLAQDAEQSAHYIPGVGTMDGRTLFRSWQKTRAVLGLAFGLGLEDDVLDAYRYLCRTYVSAEARRRAFAEAHPGEEVPEVEDDRIYIVGFSRGAYAARVLAGFIHNFGLVDPAVLHLVPQVFRAYRRITDHDAGAPDDVVFQALREYDRVLRPDPAVAIRALLLFDTVSSMIRFRRVWRNLRRTASPVEFGTHASVDRNPGVRIVRHALAVDERRSLFRAQPWVPADYWGSRFRNPGAKRRQHVEQRWFPGVHGDVGGSAPEDVAGLGKLTLLWMLDSLAGAEAETDAEDGVSGVETGLALRRGYRKRYLDGDGDATTPGGLPVCGPDALAPIHPSLRGLWQLAEGLPKSLTRREWPEGRPGLLWYLPLGEPRAIPPDHAIDDSVWLRWAKRADYRPVNVPRDRD